MSVCCLKFNLIYYKGLFCTVRTNWGSSIFQTSFLKCNLFLKTQKYLIINSIKKTITQEQTATPKRLTPKYAKAIPVISAATPEMVEFVASIIDGKVITARVTYGT